MIVFRLQKLILLRFESGFSSGKLLIPVSRSNLKLELSFFLSCTSVGDVRVVNLCCTMMIMLCILQSKRMCVVAICREEEKEHTLTFLREYSLESQILASVWKESMWENPSHEKIVFSVMRSYSIVRK